MESLGSNNDVNFGTLLLPYEYIQHAIIAHPLAFGVHSNLRCFACPDPACCEHLTVRVDLKLTFHDESFTLTAQGAGRAAPEVPVTNSCFNFNPDAAPFYPHNPHFNEIPSTVFNAVPDYPSYNEDGVNADPGNYSLQTNQANCCDPKAETEIRSVATNTDPFEQEFDNNEPEVAEALSDAKLDTSCGEPLNGNGFNEAVAESSNPLASAASINLENESPNAATGEPSGENIRRRSRGQQINFHRNPSYRRGSWDTLRCALCFSNKETEAQYSSHRIMGDDGIVSCPVLRNYVCPTCQATGDFAHTARHCPQRTDTNRHIYKPVRMATGKFYTLKY